MSKLVPVVIGVGDVVNHSTKIEDAKEPLDLILQAIDKALDDTGSASKSSIQAAIDSISIVRTWTWPYPDLPGLLASKLDVNPSHKEYTDHGGNQPGRIFDEAAKRISLGQSKIAVLAGGEALASRTTFSPIIHKPLILTPSNLLRQSQQTPPTILDQTLHKHQRRLLPHRPSTPRR